jgi:hypothetical protein
MLLYINTGTSANQGNGDNLRTAFTKVNTMFNEVYTTLNLGTTSVQDAATTVWDTPADHYGIAYYYNTSTHKMHSSLLSATNVTLGGVKIGAGILIDGNGVISVPPTYTLPVATTSTLGGIKVGTGLAIDPISYKLSNAGVLSFDGRTGPITLQSADVIGALGFTPFDSSLIAQPNGAASLDGFGKVPVNQLPEGALGGLNFQGTWNATANTPRITSGTGSRGWYYKVSIGGTTNIDGIAIWNVGDLLLYNGTTWDKIDGITAEVTSVAGRYGDVVLTFADIGGTVSRSAFTATSTATNVALGTIKLGAGIFAAADGTISVNTTAVTPATTSTLGVIKVGAGLSIDAGGLLTANVTGTGGATFNANQIGTTGTNDLILSPGSGIVKVRYTIVTEGGNNSSVFRTNQFLNAGLATDSINFSLRIVGDSNNGTTLFDAGVYNSPTALTGWSSKFLVNKTGALTMQGNLRLNGAGTGITFSDGSVQTTAVAQTTATNVKLGSVIVGNGLLIDPLGVLSVASGNTGGRITSRGPGTIASSTDPGDPGEVAWDGSYFYLAVDINTWVRLPIAPTDIPGAW